MSVLALGGDELGDRRQLERGCPGTRTAASSLLPAHCQGRRVHNKYHLLGLESPCRGPYNQCHPSHADFPPLTTPNKPSSARGTSWHCHAPSQEGGSSPGAKGPTHNSTGTRVPEHCHVSLPEDTCEGDISKEWEPLQLQFYPAGILASASLSGSGGG